MGVRTSYLHIIHLYFMDFTHDLSILDSVDLKKTIFEKHFI